ncbi:GMC family oxidoreductase [Mitsuaria sp. WAJ17]|uniref:GMC oxidoreductase n=1 Tax=Mitsuaria sp. WAJ17 TaxID=2761452 RepID=UPI0016012772|nr:GMC family oxidoreductase [Mitsuaria sp. WAJ17]MBB2485163.1 GMC family oxidoreductase [Mitsuaria sp. WAJ17]
MYDSYDVVVVGSGASGAIAASEFVRAGLRTLVLEEGGWLRPDAANALVDADAERALAGNGELGWSTRGWPWSTRNLGGGTVFYGGASFRYTDFDFDPRARITAEGLHVHWPITGADLAASYDEIEALLHVNKPSPAGAKDRPASLGLPAEHLWQAAQRLGHHPLATPLAIDRQRCDHCSLCISAQCDRGAKRDVVQAVLKPLAESPHLTLLTGVKALSLQQESARKVSAVQCLDLSSGTTRVIRGRLFVLACNAIQTAALLLRSQTSHAPRGIGNEHDMVGRGLCMKLSEYTQGVVAMDPEAVQRHPIGYRGPFSGVSVLDHYLDERCPTGVGGLIYETKHDEWQPMEVPGLLLRVETILADHPSAANRVRLSSERDRWGLPRLMIDYRTDARDAARLEYMCDRSAEWLRAAGADAIQREPSQYVMGSTHLHGTCRAGTDPTSSVVDRDGRVHSVENVHVVDGSYMPYPGGLNPTLTIQANALRIARGLARAPATAHSANALQTAAAAQGTASCS